jgi:hypothetical protein
MDGAIVLYDISVYLPPFREKENKRMHAFNNDLTPSDEDRALLPNFLRRLPRESVKLFRESFTLVTTPGVHTMREAMKQANWVTTGALLIALLLCVNVVNLLLYLASALLFHVRAFEPFWYAMAQPGGLDFLLEPSVYVLLGIVVLYGSARLLGGRGAFLPTLLINLFFQVPLVLLSTIMSLIRLAGGTWLFMPLTLVVIAIQLYSAVLQVLALRAVHQLSLGRAVSCVVLLVILLSPLTLFLGITIF